MSDHKPLFRLLSPNKRIPHMASPRVQRWSLMLSAYDYNIKYRCGIDNANADAMSRLPLEDGALGIRTPGDVVQLMEHLSTTCVTSDKIRVWTKRDPVTSRVLQYVRDGWPSDVSDESLKPYVIRKTELSVEGGYILWGSRVIIPTQGQRDVLYGLHTTHPGMQKMKSLARSYVWWPQMDSDIESTVIECSECQAGNIGRPKLYYIRGKGQNNHGAGYIWTMLDHFVEK